jgi:hypothetical protein
VVCPILHCRWLETGRIGANLFAPFARVAHRNNYLVARSTIWSRRERLIQKPDVPGIKRMLTRDGHRSKNRRPPTRPTARRSLACTDFSRFSQPVTFHDTHSLQGNTSCLHVRDSSVFVNWVTIPDIKPGKVCPCPVRSCFACCSPAALRR